MTDTLDFTAPVVDAIQRAIDIVLPPPPQLAQSAPPTPPAAQPPSLSIFTIFPQLAGIGQQLAAITSNSPIPYFLKVSNGLTVYTMLTALVQTQIEAANSLNVLGTDIAYGMNVLHTDILRAAEVAGAGATGNAQALFNQVEAQLNSDVSALVAQMGAIQQGLFNNIIQTINQIDAQETLLQNNLSNEIGATANNLQNNINATYEHANQVAQQAQSAAQSYTQTVAAGILGTLGNDVNSLTSNINAVESNLQSQIGNSVLTAEAYANNEVQSALATQVQPQLDQVKQELQTCLDPLCDTVTPNARSLGNAGNLFSWLGGLAWLGLLVGFLGESVNDPIGTGDAINDTIGAVINPVAKAFIDIIGGL